MGTTEAVIQRGDHRSGGAYLPKLSPVTKKEVRAEYLEQVAALRPEYRREYDLGPLSRDLIEGVCQCGYVKITGIPVPIPRRLLSREAGMVVPRKTDWYACDACANGWGFDQCGCGSGERWDRCHGGTDHCGAPNAIGAWGGVE
jgi:hypothetical protein